MADVNITALVGNVEALQTQLTAMTDAEAVQAEELNTFFLLWAGSLVFLMQAGFAMLAAGSIRSKNVKNILLKSVLDACLGGLIWYLWGYGVAYDEADNTGNAFIGSSQGSFALSGIDDGGDVHAHGYDWISWFFQYAFCAACATIVSGAVAERCELVAYLGYCTLIIGFIYPVVVHWVWDSRGFLYAGGENAWLGGMIDFAGSGVVHMTGGVAALVGAMMVGSREGRWSDPEVSLGHSSPLQVLGTFLLWFGWYGFNPGSTLALGGSTREAARAAVTTTLSAGAAAVTGLLIKSSLPGFLGGTPHVYDLGHTCNSLLGGLVAITAGCSVVDSWAAIPIGFLAAWVYHGGSCLMRKLKIDDPLDAFAVHGCCGLLGLWAVGFFATSDYSYSDDYGIFYGGSGKLFAIQVIGSLIQIAWVFCLTFAVFALFKAIGLLRVSKDVEHHGCDISKHGGSAYPEELRAGGPSKPSRIADAEAQEPNEIQLGLGNGANEIIPNPNDEGEPAAEVGAT